MKTKSFNGSGLVIVILIFVACHIIQNDVMATDCEKYTKPRTQKSLVELELVFNSDNEVVAIYEKRSVEALMQAILNLIRKS